MFRIRSAAGVAAVAVASLTAGCSLLASDPVASSAPEPAGVPAAAESPDPAPQPLGVEDGVVGSASLARADGTVIGEARILHERGGWRVEMPAMPADAPPQASYVWIDQEVDFADCGEHNLSQASYGDPREFPAEALATHPFLDELAGAGQDDPTFWRAVALVEYPDGVLVDGCDMTVGAIGRIAWTMPPQRPDVAPVDSGAASGADGEVFHEEGRLVEYRTASGDTWDAIAARFGMHRDELTWLNPIRTGGSERDTAYAFQLLNLDPANRGNSETRRYGNRMEEAGG